VEPVVARLKEEYLRRLGAVGILSLAEHRLGHAPIPQISAELREIADKLDEQVVAASSGIYTLSEAADRRWQRYLEVESNEQAGRGMQLGWLEFDKQNNGLKPGELLVVIANTSVGKSAFQLRTLLNLWRLDGRRVMLVNREMSNRVQHGRMEAMELSKAIGKDAQVDRLLTRIDLGELSSDEREVYREVLESYKSYDVPFWVVSPDAYSDLTELASVVARYRRREHLEVLGADSLNLMHIAGRRSDDHWLQMGANALLLKHLAVSQDIGVITDCQANRKSARRRDVTVEEVFGYSYQIMQHADVVLRLFPLNEHEIEVQVLKGRDGAAGYTFSLYFDPSNMRMEYAGP